MLLLIVIFCCKVTFFWKQPNYFQLFVYSYYAVSQFFLAERCRQPLATLRERLHLSARGDSFIALRFGTCSNLAIFQAMRIIEIDLLQNEGMDMFRSLTEAQLRNRLYHVERIIKIAIVLGKEGGGLPK